MRGTELWRCPACGITGFRTEPYGNGHIIKKRGSGFTERVGNMFAVEVLLFTLSIFCGGLRLSGLAAVAFSYLATVRALSAGDEEMEA